MTYEVKKDDKTYTIDDLVLLANQPQEVQSVINYNRQGDTAEFDNATVLLFNTGRVIINMREEVQHG